MDKDLYQVLAFQLLMDYISDMKNLILITFMLPVTAVAQTQADYDAMMKKFVGYYNQGNSKKIAGMFPLESQASIQRAYKQEEIKQAHERIGKIQSFKYIGIDTTDPELVRVYRVETTKGVRALSFNLGTDGLFGTFRQYTTSDEIDAMLRKSQ